MSGLARYAFASYLRSINVQNPAYKELIAVFDKHYSDHKPIASKVVLKPQGRIK